MCAYFSENRGDSGKSKKKKNWFLKKKFKNQLSELSEDVRVLQ